MALTALLQITALTGLFQRLLAQIDLECAGARTHANQVQYVDYATAYVMYSLRIEGIE